MLQKSTVAIVPTIFPEVSYRQPPKLHYGTHRHVHCTLCIYIYKCMYRCQYKHRRRYKSKYRFLAGALRHINRGKAHQSGKGTSLHVHAVPKKGTSIPSTSSVSFSMGALHSYCVNIMISSQDVLTAFVNLQSRSTFLLTPLPHVSICLHTFVANACHTQLHTQVAYHYKHGGQVTSSQ